MTREKSSLVRMQLAAEGKARAPPAAPDGWAEGSSCSHFPAVEALLSEHPSALRSRALSPPPRLISSPQVLPAAATIVLGTTAEADVAALCERASASAFFRSCD